MIICLPLALVRSMYLCFETVQQFVLVYPYPFFVHFVYFRDLYRTLWLLESRRLILVRLYKRPALRGLRRYRHTLVRPFPVQTEIPTHTGGSQTIQEGLLVGKKSLEPVIGLCGRDFVGRSFQANYS